MRLAWGLAASLAAHAAVVALLMTPQQPAKRPGASAAPPAIAWLRLLDPPLAEAARTGVEPQPLSLIVPPLASWAASAPIVELPHDIQPAASNAAPVAEAAASASVQGVAISLPWLGNGSGRVGGWLRRAAPAAEPASAPPLPTPAELARGASEAQRRQVLAAAQQEARVMQPSP